MGTLQKNQSGFSAVEAILILIIVGMLGFTGWYVWQAKQSANTSLSTKPTLVTTQRYVSKTDKFSVDFPSKSKIETGTQELVGGEQAPTTHYGVALDNAKRFFAVDVTHYAQSDLVPEDIKGLLSSEVSALAENNHTKLITSNYLTFLDQQAMDFQLDGATSATDDTIITLYGRVFIVDHNKYIIYTINEPKEKFTRFVNSFRLTD